MRPTAPMFPRSTRRSSILSRPSERRSEPLLKNATVVLGQRLRPVVAAPRAHLDRRCQTMYDDRPRLDREGARDAVPDLVLAADRDPLGAERAAPGREIGVGQARPLHKGALRIA